MPVCSSVVVATLPAGLLRTGPTGCCQSACRSAKCMYEAREAILTGLAAEVRDSGQGAPCLFLSHSSADTHAARELKRRLLESPQARDAGLTVWFDTDDLAAGRDWQEQIEIAITRRATAFAVYVGSKGLMNWVEREIRLGLARATGPAAIPFVPILAQSVARDALTTLPPFVQQHHAVSDPLNDQAEFAKLICAILSQTVAAPAPAKLVDEPFVGLRAMTEREADRFFGREAEVDELVDKLRRNRLVAIVADSGAAFHKTARLWDAATAKEIAVLRRESDG
jgi:hypothetical protein